MAVYGAKTYGSVRYGIGYTTAISVYPFTAQPLNYGSLQLTWKYPTSDVSFTQFAIVRSPIGFPVTADRGDLVYLASQSYISSNSLYGVTATYTDSGAFLDRIQGQYGYTFTSSNTYDVVNSKTFVLTASVINSSIVAGQYVTYATNGTLTGPNSGNGIPGGTKVASVSVSGTLYTITLTDYVTIPAGTSLTFSSTGLAPGKLITILRLFCLMELGNVRALPSALLLKTTALPMLCMIRYLLSIQPVYLAVRLPMLIKTSTFTTS